MMKAIRPITILSSDIISTTAVETVPAYNAGTNYAVGARVLFQDFIYESLQTPNTGNTPSTSPTFWLRVRPSNPTAMFDSTVSTQTTANSSLVVNIKINSAINSVAFLNITSASLLRVRLIDKSVTPNIVVFDRSINLDASIVTDWYEYFFSDFELRSDLVITDIPPYGNSQLEVTLTGAGTVGIGLLMVGTTFDLGLTRLGVSVGIRDYSVKETDQFGSTIFVQRDFSKRMSPTVFVENTRLNAVTKVLTKLRATPTVFIGSEEAEFESLIVFGFLRDWNIEIPYPNNSLLSLEVEGLT